MFGGNTIKIWLHTERGKYVVFQTYYQGSIAERSVESFDENTAWQKTLCYLIRNEDKIAARIEKAEKKADKQSQKKNRERQKVEQLQKDAARLRL